MTSPAVRVDPAPTATFDKNHSGQYGTAYSDHWSGPVLAQPGFTPGIAYYQIWSEFNVPTIIPNDVGMTAEASIWAGMGGSNLVGGNQNAIAMPQLGVDFDYVKFCTPPPWNQCSYSPNLAPWAEYYNDLNTYTMNVPVSQGDTVYVTTYPSDQYGTRNLNGGYGYFYMQDINNGHYYSTVLWGNGNQYIGATAEAILERLAVPGSSPPAFYPVTKFSGANVLYFYAVDTNNAYHDMSTDEYWNYELMNQITNLSTAYNLATWRATSNDSASFTWDAAE